MGVAIPSDDTVRRLTEHWARNWPQLGADEPPPALLHRLLAAYREPHRAYHTLDHLLECLDLAEEAEGRAEHAAEVAAALWFHDAVYDPTRHDNENQSAEWAAAALTEKGVAPAVVARVAELVRATDHRTPRALTGDAMLVHDIDLAILGAGEERFHEYQAQIRREYGWVLHSVYRAERRMILRSFLDRERIYLDDHFAARFENQARANLAAALA